MHLATRAAVQSKPAIPRIMPCRCEFKRLPRLLLSRRACCQVHFADSCTLQPSHPHESEPTMLFSRDSILTKLRAKVAAGQPIVGGGAGTGISAKMSEAGGVDLLVIYNSGRFRMAGRGSLSGMMPYGDANAIVMEMAREVLPAIRHTPVLAGVCGTD